MLVKAGADILARDKMGLTPVDMAHIWNHRNIARYPAKDPAEPKAAQKQSYVGLIQTEPFCFPQVLEALLVVLRKEGRIGGDKVGSDVIQRSHRSGQAEKSG